MTLAIEPITPLPELHRGRSLHNVWARFVNRVAVLLCWTSALVTIGALFLIFGYIVYKGVWALTGLEFTTHFPWFDFTHFHLNATFFTSLPRPGDAVGGMRNCIAGTLVLIAMASVIGIPVGMLCGIYLAEYSKDNLFSHSVRLVVDVLAGVPSIIVGVLAYSLVVRPMGNNSAWAGAVALGFIMCPIIARTTEEMLKLVPKALREASIGLGASKFQTLFRVVIPAAASGIITGVMLSVARVAGETAPLLFTVLGSDQPIFSMNSHFPFFHADLNNAFPSLTAQIYKYATSAEPEWLKEAWGGMLVLIMIVLIMNIMVRVVTAKKMAGRH